MLPRLCLCVGGKSHDQELSCRAVSPSVAGTPGAKPLTSQGGLGLLVWPVRGGQSGCWLLRDPETLSLPPLSCAFLHHMGRASCTSPSHLPGALPALSKGGLWFGTSHPLPATGSLFLLYQSPSSGLSSPHLSSASQGGSRSVIGVSPQSAFPACPWSTPPPMTQRPGRQSQACPCDHVIVLGESLVPFKGKV